MSHFQRNAGSIPTNGIQNINQQYNPNMPIARMNNNPVMANQQQQKNAFPANPNQYGQVPLNRVAPQFPQRSQNRQAGVPQNEWEQFFSQSTGGAPSNSQPTYNSHQPSNVGQIQRHGGDLEMRQMLSKAVSNRDAFIQQQTEASYRFQQGGNGFEQPQQNYNSRQQVIGSMASNSNQGQPFRQMHSMRPLASQPSESLPFGNIQNRSTPYDPYGADSIAARSSSQAMRQLEGDYYADDYEVESQLSALPSRERSSTQQMTHNYDAMAKSIPRGGVSSVGAQQVMRGKLSVNENLQSGQGWIPSRQESIPHQRIQQFPSGSRVSSDRLSERNSSNPLGGSFVSKSTKMPGFGSRGGKWSEEYINPADFVFNPGHTMFQSEPQTAVFFPSTVKSFHAAVKPRGMDSTQNGKTNVNLKFFSKVDDSGYSKYKRDRSRSPSARSRSGSNARSRARRDRGDFRSSSPPMSRLKRSALSRSPPRSARTQRSPSPSTHTNTQANTSVKKVFDFSKLSPNELVSQYHFPAFNRHVQQLTTLDLNSKLPNLYVPSDFIDIKMEWNSITDALNYDFFFNVTNSVPIVFENTPSFLRSSSEEKKSSYSDILNPPKFSYTHCNTVNNTISEIPLFMDRFINTTKPIKFNAKVIVCCGFKDPDAESVDHNLTRKLRMLCGRRKGSVVLLGSSWCRDLDGGDPLVDRSCLLNTARRALFAQSLLDIAKGDPSSNIVKLCEINYHRPREEIKGRIYPEQEEVTAMFLFSIQPNLFDGVSMSEFESMWSLFSDRVRGINAGPLLSKSVQQFEDDTCYQHQLSEDVNAEEAENLSDPISPESHIDIVRDSTVSAIVENSPDMDAENQNIPCVLESAEQSNSGKDESKQDDNPKPLSITKPESPAVLLCPMPLPKEVESDLTRKQDGLSLRMMPLSTILSYSLEDCSERIFEVSLAGEIVTSCISLAQANAVTDFLVAGNSTLAYLADVRVFHAIRKLKDMENKKGESTSTAGNGLEAPIISTDGPGGEKDSDAVANKLLEQTEVELGVLEQKSLIVENSVISMDENPAENPFNSSVSETQEDNLQVVRDTNETEADEDNQMKRDSEIPNEFEGDEDETMTEDEARMWRMRFVSACRWFDIHQERFIRQDVLQMIIHSSYRNLSRADVVSVAEDVCKDEKFRYDSFV